MDEVPVGGALGGFTFGPVHLAVKNRCLWVASTQWLTELRTV